MSDSAPQRSKPTAETRGEAPGRRTPLPPASTRSKHGLLAEGVTELDSPEMSSALRAGLDAELKPVRGIDTFLMRQIASGMVRLKRAARLEAKFTTEEFKPPIIENHCPVHHLLEAHNAERRMVTEPGNPARLSSGAEDSVVSQFGRYETQIENRLFRHLHELERLQRSRSGENIPAPASADVAVHGDKPLVASFGKPHKEQSGSRNAR